MTSNIIREVAEQALAEAAEARKFMEFHEILFLGPTGITDPGRHYDNYANMIWNRILSLYDDCALLLGADRIPAACAMARCILETYAVGEFSKHEVAKAFGKGGIAAAGEVVLAYINSSRLKVEEQKRFKAGTFSRDDYHFTEQALQRMTNEEAVSKHILNALRNLFKREMDITQRNESQFELTYETLSEWTHPSQTSLFHAFAKQAWTVETSAGLISIWDGALAACARGMHFVTAVPELVGNMKDVADQLSEAYASAA